MTITEPRAACPCERRCCCCHQPITALPAANCDPCKLGRHIECERR